MSPVANMLIQIKNAQLAKKDHVMVPYSELKSRIANLLKEAGYLDLVEKKKRQVKKAELSYLFIKLNYENGDKVIHDIKLVSKPSRRIYGKSKELTKVLNGYGLSVVSTSQGIMTGEDAGKKGIGGEVICEIW